MSDTPIRKRLIRPIDNSSLNSTLNQSIQDDEEERRERRRSLAPSRKSIDPEEAKTHIEMCKQMFLENKITTKNAWNLRIIDFLTNVVNTHTHEKEHLQQAAATLEVCTKVYACRVDDLHAAGVKLANALVAQEEVSGDIQVDDNNEAEGEGKKKRKKKKPTLSLNSAQYVAKEVESLLGPIPKLSDVPFNIETDGDPEKTTNMFTNTIPFDQNYKDHLRDKENVCFLSYNQEDDVNEESIAKFIPKIKTIKICAEFENFEVNIVDLNLNNTLETNASICPSIAGPAQSVFDEHGHPIVELDGSMHDIFANQDDGIHEEEIEGVPNAAHKAYQEVQVVSFCPGEETVNGEQISNACTTLNEGASKWAHMMLIGPNHWKNKRLQRSALRYSGAVNEQKPVKRKLKARKDEEPIDFTKEVEFDLSVKVKSVNRVVTDEWKHLMPRNYLKRLRNDQMLMLMEYIPEKSYSAGKENHQEEEFNHECQDYNYDNFNDSQYCLAGDKENEPPADIQNVSAHSAISQTNTDQNVLNPENDVFGETIEEEIRNLNAIDRADLSLDAIPQPTLPPYALKAKKINMKRIKATMIGILKHHGVLSEKVPKESENIRSTKFTELYKELNEDLPKNIAEEMSMPIAFFALLHLANEEGLNLIRCDDLLDVIVSNEVPVPPHLRN